MGLAARQAWSARSIVSLISLVALVLTCLRYYYQESQAAWNFTGVINEQRIHEQQGALKEHQFQESIQDIMNATLGVLAAGRYFGRFSFR